MSGFPDSVFSGVAVGDPCAAHPTLVWRARPYNQALTEAVLIPFLETRRDAAGDRRRIREAARQALAASTEAFAAALPEASRSGDGAIVAALSVTANLQRTIDRLTREPGPPAGLSRVWCGYPPDPVRRDPGRGSSRRRGVTLPDLRPVARALRCSCGEVRAQCEEALAALREEIRAGRLVAREDLPRLPAPKRIQE